MGQRIVGAFGRNDFDFDDLIAAAAGLSVALCMFEQEATIMVYPASWRTLPVTIFTQSDRGDLFSAAANTLLLVLVSVAILGLLSRIRSRAQVR